MQDKLKRKADKLTKQSFALLDRIKQRKEKKTSAQNQQNYIDDLYLKIIGKCSPHFNKMETSNELYDFFKQKISEISKLKIENQMTTDQCRQLKEQVLRLKESKDESSRMKALNQEIVMLEDKVQSLNMQIKSAMQEKVAQQEEMRLLKQESLTLKNTNQELQDIVQKLSAELETIASQELPREEPKFMNKTVSGEMETTKSENQMLKNQNQQLIKEKTELSEKVYRLEKEILTKKSDIKPVQQKYEKAIEALKQELEKLQKQNRQMKQTINILESNKANKDSHSLELENIRKNLLRSELEVANFKKEREKVQQENVERSKAYQNQKSAYVAKINELSYNYELKLNQLAELKMTSETQITKQIKGIYKLNENILQLESALTEANKEKASLKASLETLQQKYFQLETLTKVLRTQLDSTAKNADSMTKKMSENEHNFKAKDQELEKRQQLIEEKDKEITEMKQKLRKIESQVAKLNEEHSILYSLHDQAKNDIERYKKEKSQSESALNFLKQEHETKLQEVQQRCKFFKESNENLNNQKVDLISNIEMLAEEIKSLHEEMQNQKEKNNSDIKIKEQQIEKLTKQIKCLNRQLQQLKASKVDESVEQQLLLQTNDKVVVDNKNHQTISKHIETIQELTHQLTEAYNTIGSLQRKISQLQVGTSKKVVAKKSPDSKDRGNSLKKFFGF